MDTTILQFEEVKPLLSPRLSLDSIRVAKNRLSIGKQSYINLGEPSSLKVEIDPRNHVIKLSTQGPFSLSKYRTVTNSDFLKMEEGLYNPVGKGLYQWAPEQRSRTED